MPKLSKLFAGFIALLRLEEHFVSNLPPENCALKPLEEGKFYADCVGKNFHRQFPDHLDSKIEILNLSKSRQAPLRSPEFDKLSSLVELVIRSITTSSAGLYSTSFLMTLPQLKKLDISQSDFYPTLKLPTSLTHFYANSIPGESGLFLTAIDFSKLNNLVEISVYNNKLSGLLLLNKQAPLRSINMNENPITELQYIHLAPYCHLKTFELSEYFPGDQYQERCCYTKVWLKIYEVSTSLNCDILCNEADIKSKFDEDAIRSREECLNESSTASVDLWSIVLHTALFTAIIAAFSYLTYKFYTSHAVRGAREPDVSVSVFEESEEEPIIEEEKIIGP